MFCREFSFPHSFFRLKIFAVFLFIIFFVSSACNSAKSNNFVSNEKLKDYPQIILWAWERPENLKFIDTKKYGVAFLAQTINLQNDEVVLQSRRQALEVSPETFLIAVTRIETNKLQQNNRPSLSDSQKGQVINLIKKTLDLPNVRAIQVDFDALVSERSFYQSLLKELRPQLPENITLTMTALASWCISDNWFADLPVDEVVPMAFRMGADDKQVRALLAARDDWHNSLCKGSYGIALDEPLQMKFNPNRRLYIFNNRPWRAEDLKRLPKGVS